MNDRLAGYFFTTVGVLAAGTSVLGIVREQVWFLARNGSRVLIDHSGTPALYWFVVSFYFVGGAISMLFGIKMLRHNDMCE